MKVPFIDTSSEIVAYKSFNSAFVFELKRVITNYRDIEAIKSQMSQHETGYVISRTEHQEELEQIEGLMYVTEARDTFENPTTLIMKWGN